MINKSNLLNILSITNKLKVLYVEDNEESRNQAMKLFENYFNHVDIAVDGKDGLELYDNFHIETGQYYDLVITDIQMPNMDGIKMSKSIYKINKKQKIIIISAYSDKKYLIDLINMGVEGFLQKPLSFEQVSEALKEVCTTLEEMSIVSIASDCKYNKLTHQLSCDNSIIDITINEQRFIEFFIENNNTPSSQKDIFNYIFYEEPHKKFTADSIKGLIKRLRKKVSDHFIINSRTTGYSLNIN